jgi:hypothetical protein
MYSTSEFRRHAANLASAARSLRDAGLVATGGPFDYFATAAADAARAAARAAEDAEDAAATDAARAAEDAVEDARAADARAYIAGRAHSAAAGPYLHDAHSAAAHAVAAVDRAAQVFEQEANRLDARG